MCVSCADSLYPETGPGDSTDVPAKRSEDEASASQWSTKKQSLAERRHTLDKRATDRKQITVCGNNYQSGPYTTGNAGNIFPSWGYKYIVNSQSQCLWNFQGLSSPAGAAPPATQGGSYQSELTCLPHSSQLQASLTLVPAEHVYEAQLVTQFAEYIQSKDTGNACGQGKLVPTYLMRTGAFPGRTGGSKFTGGSPLAELMLDLSDNTRPNELTALDKDLNILKAAVFNGDTNNFASANVAAGKLAKVTRFAMLLVYLRDPYVSTAFKNTSNRIRATLQKLDSEIAASTIRNPGFSFLTEYGTWEDNFLFGQGTKVELAADAIISAAKTQVQNDQSIGSQALRDSFIAQINGKTAFGQIADPSAWVDLDDALKP